VAEDKAKLDLNKVPGANVKRLRDAKLWSQEKLADESGLDRTEVQKVETGNRNPGVEVVLKLAAGLGVTPNDLLQGAKWDSEKDDFTYDDAGDPE
jgi:transcriptional regulator with XRE-family HTH domain